MTARGRPRARVDVEAVRAMRGAGLGWQTIERRIRISARTLKRHVRDAERGPRPGNAPQVSAKFEAGHSR